MKEIKYLFLVFFFMTGVSIAQKNPESTELWEPIPAKVTSGEIGLPPSDAIVLFNGGNLSNFESVDGSKANWTVLNDILIINPEAQSIKTKQKFGDCQLHIEWSVPIDDINQGQSKGNSGIFLMERYELQILDSWENMTYSNGQAASVYKQHIPLVNASKKPGEWQSYDIIFIAPRFNKSGGIISPSKLTVFHNGVLVHYNVSLLGTTEFIGMPVYKSHGDKEPLMIQNHGAPVRFKNIWIREL